ncbi:MAG TPA: hypothetical protein PK926_08415 [Spirochaetota bacterium]|nr:hypothetical protein [Spirochaetota bacterium]HPI89852.1 hypothetical protein [Spirochaetota bacterium]HPR48635.1 hypothetical protein [Spirochaetota bacterium]
MKIYQLANNNRKRTSIHGLRRGLSVAKKAAGAEDLILLTREARESFNRDNVVKLKEQELKNLALKHINDYYPGMEKYDTDPEFIRAEKMTRLAELVVRIIPTGRHRDIHNRISEFVVNQLVEENEREQ